MSEPSDPLGPRAQTLRESIRGTLRAQGPMTLIELSGAVGVSTKALPDHLRHLERSLERSGEALVMEPPRCIGCGFEFGARSRFTRPGKCPKCRSVRIAPPVVGIR